MTKKQKGQIAMDVLEKVYPDAICSLSYAEAYQLLIATRLAAQCTDARVNTVTPVLFGRYPTLEDLAHAKLEDVEEIVHPCGLYKTKAKSIIGLSNMLLDIYGGVVPDTMEELLTLPGIGRKTANLVLGDVYHKPAVVTDTHCIRICGRLGLINTTVPAKAEEQLRKILDLNCSSDFCHRLVHFGRDTCKARKPACENCPLSDICEYVKKS